MVCTARRMFELLEPICLVTYFAEECNEELAALGHRTYWDGYFASRAAPLGWVPAQVVHAAFYSFADGEAARHIPSAWETIPPEASVAARERGSAASVRRILGDELADSPGLVRAADLTTKAATSAPMEGRVMYAGMRTLPVPGDPVARLWHSATMLREHRGDGHVACLLRAGLTGLESLVTHTLTGRGFTETAAKATRGWSDEEWAAAVDRLAARGLVADGALTEAGVALRAEIEAGTDELSAAPWVHLGPERTTRVVELGRGLSARLVAAGAYPAGVLAAR
jgi:hypothetical protein